MKTPLVKNILIGFGIILVSLLYYRLFWPNLNSFVQSVDQCDLLFCDFAKYYYPQALITFHSQVPAYKFFYSSFFAILISVFSFVNFKMGMLIWFFLQILFTLLLYLFPARYLFNKSKYLGFFYLFLILISVPTLHNFKWGQISTLINALLIGSWCVSYRRKSMSALVLAFAIAVKYYAIFMLLYFILKKEWKVVRETIFWVIAFLFVIPCLFLGFTNYIEFNIDFLKQIPKMRSDWATETNSQFVAVVMNRYLSWLFQIGINFATLKSIGYLIVLAQWILVAILYAKKKIKEDAQIFCLFLLSTPFLVEPSWPHYFTYLPFCQIATLSFTANSNCKIVCRSLVGVSIGLSSIVCFHFVTNWVQYSYFGCLFISNLLLVIVCWVDLLGPEIKHKKRADYSALSYLKQ